jgi:DNA-binding GntR family transcriptional regulator
MYKNTSNLSAGFDFGESLPQQISKHILTKIIQGDFKAGEKIVEEEIAKELNTSRAPVREALYLLQVDGIVERQPRRGTIVKAFTQKEIVEYNDVMIGLIQMTVEFSKGKWQPENKQQLSMYLERATAQCKQGNVIEYQMKAEQLLKYILLLADNKALARFYEEANHILKVFAQVQWNTVTMENFHSNLKAFVKAVLDEDFAKANKAIFETLKCGVI